MAGHKDDATTRQAGRARSESDAKRQVARPLHGLGLALALGVAALAWSAWGRLSGALSAFSSDISQMVVASFRATPLLQRQLAFLVLALLLLHLLLGLLAWACARACEAAARLSSHHRRRLVLAWFLWLFALVGIANATLYPWSVSAGASRLALTLTQGEHWLMIAMIVLTVLAVAAMLTMLFHRSRWAGHGRRVLVWAGLILVVAATWINMPRTEVSATTLAPARPNVILIGIDSLRPDVTGALGEAGFMPHLADYLADTQVFADALTPLARTFPSWMATLTGRSPASTNVRENLTPRESIRVSPTLADRLRAAGYRTVFATDEVRFSNIDASYGFDQTITPRVGASDFLLGGLNDLPLSNLLANTRVARWLFPDTYANRGASVTYRPATFIRRLQAELQTAEPVFFATHLTLPHWPYVWADSERGAFADATRQPYPYLAAVMAVDAQFRDLMALLEARGTLRHAIVIVLSDHGEALGLPRDNPVYSRAAKAAARGFSVWMHGHGTSALSTYQYRVLLSVRGYGVPMISTTGRIDDTLPLTLEDIAPTVSSLVGLEARAGDFDGLSFAPYLAGAAPPAPEFTQRIRYTETAFSTPSLRSGTANEASLLAESGQFFRVNPANARLELAPDSWPGLLAVKERAAIGPRATLVAQAATEPGKHRYLLVPRDGSLPQRLTEAPDAADPGEARILWQALQQRFAGELGPPSAN